jgi:hypothetical protein
MFNFTFIALVLMFNSVDPPAIANVSSPNGPIIKKSGSKRKLPVCKSKTNPGNILRVERYEVHIKLLEKSITLTRKISLVPTTAWKHKCIHHLKLGFPLTDKILKGKIRKSYFSIVPETKTEFKTEFFEFKPSVKIKSKNITGWIGISNIMNPTGGKPTANKFILEIKQIKIPYPEANTEEFRKITFPTTLLNLFTPGNSFKINIFIEMAKPWRFAGSNWPDEKILGNRIGWKLNKLPEEDFIFMFADFDIEKTYLKKKKKKTESDSNYIILGLILGILISGIFVLHNVVSKKKALREPQGPEEEALREPQGPEEKEEKKEKEEEEEDKDKEEDKDTDTDKDKD